MLIIAWETTSACNLKCSYCRAMASEEPALNELTTFESLDFIDQVASLKPMLILSGGEPLLRSDIFHLAKHAISKGLRVSLATNGTLLTTEVVDEIVASGISRVSISLDGVSEDKHDLNRGPGSFMKAMKGIENLRGRAEFQINFTVTNRNAKDVSAIFALAEGLGAKALHFFFLIPTGRCRAEDVISAERQEELLRLIDKERWRRLLEVRVTCAPQYSRIAHAEHGEHTRGCLAGSGFVFISRSGEVFPCGYLPIKAGSLREKKFMEIWEKSPVLRALREGDLKGKCGICCYRKICGGCRARAFVQSEDFLGSDPICNLEVC